MKCKARQYSDQMVCHDCRLVWDKSDPEPPSRKCQEPVEDHKQQCTLANLCSFLGTTEEKVRL